MQRSEQLPQGPDSPSSGRPDLLRHVGARRSPPSPLYLSFFEEECREIVSRLRLNAASAAQPAGDSGESSIVWPDDAQLVTSTPLGSSPPPHQGPPAGAAPAARPSVGRCGAASGPARGQARRLPQPSAGGARSGPLLARPQSPARKAARCGAGQPPCGGPGLTVRPRGLAVRPRTPARSLGCGRVRASLSRTQASLGPELPKAGRGLGAQGSRLPQAAGTRLKPMPAAQTGPKHPSRASQLAQRPTAPKPAPRDAEVETAVKVGCCRQPSRRLSTAISTASARSRLQPLKKLASPKRFCLGKHDQTWVCVESSFSSKLAPGPAPWCGDAVLPEQPAGDQLSMELERVKSELQRVKGELAEKTTQCEAYRQMISSLQAQLRAKGICLADAAVEESGKG